MKKNYKQKIKIENKKTTRVYTCGTWDLFHIGHLNILKKSKALGTELIVGVSSDKLVKSYKKSYPTIPFEDRIKIIQHLNIVDKVVRQDNLLDIKQMKKMHIDILTIGSDWKNKHLDGLEWAKKQSNIKVVYLPYTKRISSTKIKEMSGLKNKNVLITGASSGIGSSIAKKFAEQGANIGIHYSKNKKGALELAKKLSEKTTVKTYSLDFTSNKLDLVHKFVKDFGSIDILVNNAGIISSKSFFDMSIKDYDEIFKINSRTPFFLSKDAFNYMKKDKKGKIINIGSVAVKYGLGRNNSIQYAATKSTLETLTKGLSRIGAEHNILVNCIRPGIILTRIHTGRKDFYKRINMIPLKRVGEVEDVSNLAIYLASDKGDFITGEIITVSGGD